MSWQAHPKHHPAETIRTLGSLVQLTPCWRRPAAETTLNADLRRVHAAVLERIKTKIAECNEHRHLSYLTQQADAFRKQLADIAGKIRMAEKHRDSLISEHGDGLGMVLHELQGFHAQHEAVQKALADLRPLIFDARRDVEVVAGAITTDAVNAHIAKAKQDLADAEAAILEKMGTALDRYASALWVIRSAYSITAALNRQAVSALPTGGMALAHKERELVTA